MRIRRLTKNIIHVERDSYKELASIFCRYQEHYEHPVFAGKVFTLGQFRDWYIKNTGKWTYDSDWAGFNLPGYVFESFKAGMFDSLSENETKLLRAVKDMKGKFYVIGSKKGDELSLSHEFLHAIYYVNDKYRKAVIKLFKKHKLNKLKKHLIDISYHKDVLIDECQAYIGANSEWLKFNELEVDETVFDSVHSLIKLHVIKNAPRLIAKSLESEFSIKPGKTIKVGKRNL
jgi:hypothetical protein